MEVRLTSKIFVAAQDESGEFWVGMKNGQRVSLSGVITKTLSLNGRVISLGSYASGDSMFGRMVLAVYIMVPTPSEMDGIMGIDNAETEQRADPETTGEY